MYLQELIPYIPGCTVVGEGNPIVSDIAYDSRCVVPGSLFVVRVGSVDTGEAYIQSAKAQGAVALLCQSVPHKTAQLPCIVCNDVRAISGLLAAKIFNVDAEKLCVVGITGTNGKTTSTFLAREIIATKFSKPATWMYTTVGNFCEDTFAVAKNTTPESIDIFKQIAKSESKPAAVCMEVSSHALSCARISGLLYDVAIFTNLTQDHLDFHGDMESYYQAKKLLFTRFKKTRGSSIINIDDLYGQRLADDPDITNVITFGQNQNADLRIVSWSCSLKVTTIVLEYENTSYTFTSSLRGLFNVYNCTGALCAGFALKIDPIIMARALAQSACVPGRLEEIVTTSGISVFVDYAHTPDALENVLSTLRELTTGKIVCVFGCGGDRDIGKRPRMGEVVARLADEAIVTSDNPRSENPHTILKQIIKGIPLDFPHHVIADRYEAIKKGLSLVAQGDVLLVAGKGHETYQEICGVRHHFSDQETLRSLLKEKGESHALV